MQKANRLLSEKLDGMLSPRENAALAKHLDQCPACRRRLTVICSWMRRLLI